MLFEQPVQRDPEIGDLHLAAVGDQQCIRQAVFETVQECLSSHLRDLGFEVFIEPLQHFHIRRVGDGAPVPAQFLVQTIGGRVEQQNSDVHWGFGG